MVRTLYRGGLSLLHVTARRSMHRHQRSVLHSRAEWRGMQSQYRGAISQYHSGLSEVEIINRAQEWEACLGHSKRNPCLGSMCDLFDHESFQVRVIAHPLGFGPRGQLAVKPAYRVRRCSRLSMPSRSCTACRRACARGGPGLTLSTPVDTSHCVYTKTCTIRRKRKPWAS